MSSCKPLSKLQVKNYYKDLNISKQIFSRLKLWKSSIFQHRSFSEYKREVQSSSSTSHCKTEDTCTRPKCLTDTLLSPDHVGIRPRNSRTEAEVQSFGRTDSRSPQCSLDQQSIIHNGISSVCDVSSSPDYDSCDIGHPHTSQPTKEHNRSYAETSRRGRSDRPVKHKPKRHPECDPSFCDSYALCDLCESLKYERVRYSSPPRFTYLDSPIPIDSVVTPTIARTDEDSVIPVVMPTIARTDEDSESSAAPTTLQADVQEFPKCDLDVELIHPKCIDIRNLCPSPMHTKDLWYAFYSSVQMCILHLLSIQLCLGIGLIRYASLSRMVYDRGKSGPSSWPLSYE